MRRILSVLLVALAFAGCQGDKPEILEAVERERAERARPAGERQAVSGREYRMVMEDRDGKEWLLTDRVLIMEVERALVAEGFDVTVDGEADKETLRELTKFQLKNGIHPSGELDQESFAKLGLDYDRFARHKVPKR